MPMISRHESKPGVYVLQMEMWLPRGIHEVFDFFADAYRLEQITPPWLHFHVLTPKPVEMFAGTKIDYALRLHGIPIRWQSEISEWEPPFHFVIASFMARIDCGVTDTRLRSETAARW